MRTIKASAMAIATALGGVHAAMKDIDGGAELEAAVTVLHKELRAGLYRHRSALGLSSEDVVQVDELGGGTPKTDEPEDEGGG